METDSARIRRYNPADLGGLYDICVRTADNGGDGTALFRDPRLPGEVYAAPYALFEPALALVAEDPAGVGGYVVGALDSLIFERQLDRDWWPALRTRYPEPPPEVADRLSEPERRALHDIHHPWTTEAALAEHYPSHLHINLLPRLQGRGLGRQLIAALISDLRERGSAGVHLMVGRANQRAVGFYRHVGFTELPSSARYAFGTALSFGLALQEPAAIAEAREVQLP